MLVSISPMLISLVERLNTNPDSGYLARLTKPFRCSDCIMFFNDAMGIRSVSAMVLTRNGSVGFLAHNQSL